jgi:hypothetical protein
VKAGRQIDTWQGVFQRQAFTPALILFIALPEAEYKAGAAESAIPLHLLPRRCPVCGDETIVGHGKRRRQAHDQQHDWIWIRRGRCPRCRKTFTILPVWLPPYSHYSIDSRRQACDAVCNQGLGWEEAAPHCRDPTRLPDPGTLRRWAWRRIVSLWHAMKVWMFFPQALKLFQTPTILVWDWVASSRMLLLKVNSS